MTGSRVISILRSMFAVEDLSRLTRRGGAVGVCGLGESVSVDVGVVLRGDAGGGG